MTSHIISTSSNGGIIKANTGFTDWLWVPMHSSGALAHNRADSTGGTITFTQGDGLLANCYETQFECTLNATENIAYGDTAGAFNELCRIDNLTSGWVIFVAVVRMGSQRAYNTGNQEWWMGYGQATDGDGYWYLRYRTSDGLALIFRDGDANDFLIEPASSTLLATSATNMVAVAFDAANSTAHLYVGDSANDLASPVGTSASYSAISSTKLPGGSKTYGLALGSRFNGGALDSEPLGNGRTKDGTAEVFAKHFMVMRAENATTKTSADVGELLGDLYTSLPSLPASMQEWGSS